MDVDACGLGVNSPEPIECHRCRMSYPSNLPECPKCHDLSDFKAIKLGYELPEKVKKGNRTIRIILFIGALICLWILFLTYI